MSPPRAGGAIPPRARVQGSSTLTRDNAFSFSATAPFTVTSWAPNVNGTINSIAFNNGDCSHAYIGGR